MFYRKLLKKAVNTKFFTKLVLVYIFIIFIPVSLAGIYSYRSFNRTMEQELYTSLYEVSSQVSKNLEFNFREMESMVNLIRLKPDIMEILRKRYSRDPFSSGDPELIWEYMEDRQNITDFIQGLMHIQSSCIEIGVYTTDGRIYRQSKRARRFAGDSNTDLSNFDWYARALENDGRRVFLGAHKQTQVEDGEYVFSLTRLIKDDDGRPLAVVLVDYDFKILENICNMINFGVNQNIFILDENLEIVYRQKESPFPDFSQYSLSSELYYSPSVRFETAVEEEKFFVTSIMEERSGWRIVSMVPVRELAGRYNFVGNVTLTVLFTVLLLVTIISLIAFKTIYKPVKELSEVMGIAAMGNLDVRYSFEGDNEIGKLSKSFNYMIANIKNLMESEKKSQAMIRESEIRALQAQINPHFLYNTLNAIKWMAMDVKAEKIKVTVNSLVHLLKSTISNKDNLITFEDEFANIKHFARIQSVRYDRDFNIEYRIEDDVKNLYTLKLLIQPIVENAIFHGISGDDIKDAAISISASKNINCVTVTVSDNGKGMSGETVEKILGPENDRKWQFTGIGMKNVIERIKLNYGNEYGVDIYSRKNSGTRVVLRLPVIEKGEYN